MNLTEPIPLPGQIPQSELLRRKNIIEAQIETTRVRVTILSNPDWAKFTEQLQGVLFRYVSMLTRETDLSEVYRLQGRVQVLEQLMEDPVQSGEKLKKLLEIHRNLESAINGESQPVDGKRVSG